MTNETYTVVVTEDDPMFDFDDTSQLEPLQD